VDKNPTLNANFENWKWNYGYQLLQAYGCRRSKCSFNLLSVQSLSFLWRFTFKLVGYIATDTRTVAVVAAAAAAITGHSMTQVIMSTGRLPQPCWRSCCPLLRHL